MRLRKCHCGGTAKTYGIEEGELRRVYCQKCGYETISYFDGIRAQANWNFLMRTRHLVSLIKADSGSLI